MKKLLCGLMAFVMLLGTMSGFTASAAVSTSTDKDFRAVWVSSVLNLDFPSKKSLTVDQMKREITDTIDNAVRIGMNAIILQVRPCADALYPSDIFPWSEYLGSQGVAPAGGFDPLAYWIEQCHAVGLELHAWVNPYRVTHTSAKRTDVNVLALKSPARKNPSWVIAYQNALYFDPGLPETRQLVIDGVKEIITKYDVDGIHLDDYFYPGTDFKDDASYKKYGAGMKRDDWRRDNVNKLVQGLQDMIRKTKPAVRFGISPFAIWQNKSTSAPLGSDTRGGESYNQMYADTRRWVKEGWVDYICPQIYWLIGYEIADYEKVLAWWVDVCRGTGVDLYVGHAAYREAEGQKGWDGEMVRQLQYNETRYADAVQGDVFFRSNLLKGSVGTQLARYYTTNINPPTLRMTDLLVMQPSKNVSTTGSGYNIMGTCLPGVPLYMNGKLVEGVTAEGFFSIYVPVAKGANTFVFSQKGETNITRVITGTTASGGGSAATMAAVGVTNAYPAKDEYVPVGGSIAFKCTAPIGATVTVTLNGKTTTLTPATTKKPSGSAIYTTTFTGTQTFTSNLTGNVENLGKPVYTVKLNGQTKTATAAAVWLVQKNAPLHAMVTADSAWLYPNATTDGGSAWQAVKNQRDTVTAVTKDGAWVKLGSGVWIESANVNIAKEATRSENLLSAGKYVRVGYEDVLQWNAKQNPITNIKHSGKTVTIQFGLQSVVPPHGITDALLKDSMFKSISGSVVGGVPQLVLTLKDDARLEGFYTSFKNGVFGIHFKNAKPLAAGSKPLTGFTFVIDAGHGGSDTGATGPMGAKLAEKHINLSNADRLTAHLQALGAEVTRVRVSDTYYTLNERTEVSRFINPDMFISMHANSMSETTNASTIRGFSVWYRNELSKPLADNIINDLFLINPITTRRQLSNQSNFYVCRPSWAPSVIIEASFMCNVDDFSWLVNEQEQERMAGAMVQSILRYYGK